MNILDGIHYKQYLDPTQIRLKETSDEKVFDNKTVCVQCPAVQPNRLTLLVIISQAITNHT